MKQHSTLRRLLPFAFALAAALSVGLISARPAFGETPTPAPTAPTDPGAHALLEAQRLADAGDSVGALAQLKQAVALYRAAGNADGEVAAHFYLALYLRQIGQYEEALTAYQDALTAAVPLRNVIVDASLWLGIGDCRNLLKQPEDALAAYEKSAALYLASNDAGARRGEISALNSAGNTLHALGRYEAAIAKFEAGIPLALALADLRAELMLQSGLGNAYAALGDQRASGEHHRKALAAYTRGRELAEKLNDAQWQQLSLLGSGGAHSSLGEYAAAYADFQAGIALAQARQDAAGEALLRMDAGLALHDAGRYGHALPQLEQALSLEQATGNQTRQALVLTQIGATLEALGRNTDALARYEAANALADDLGDAGLRARVKNDLGLLYDLLGRGQEARATSEAARQLAEQAGEPKVQGKALNNLGTVLNRRGEYAEAARLYNAALAIFRQARATADEAITLNNLAQNYDSQGRYDEARPLYDQALAIHQKHANDVGAATVTENMAGQDAALGRYRAALERYQAALTVFKDHGLLNEQATALSNLATLYSTLGQFDEAHKRYDEALALRRQLGDRAGEGIVLGNLAAQDYEQSNYDAALAGYRQAAAIAQAVGDPSAAATWQNHVAAVLSELGRDQEAHDAYQDALDRFRTLGDRAGEAAALNGLGITQLKLPFPEEGLALLDQALAIYTDLGEVAGQATALANKAYLLEQFGRYDEALDAYRAALAFREQLRGAAPGEALRVGLTQDAAAVYDAAATLAMKLGRGEEAFALTERARSRQLLDQLNAGRLDLAAGADAALLQREQALRTEISRLDQGARAERVKPSTQRNADRAQALNASLTARRAEYDSLLREIKSRNPQYAAMVSAEPASLAQIQTLLPQDVTLVSYYIGIDASFAFIIQATSFHTVTLQAPAAEVWQQVVSFRDSFTDLKNPFPSSLSWLSNRLITPVAPYLTTPVVGIVPHGPLHYLPFAALYWTGPEPAARKAAEKPGPLTPFADRFVLFTLPSASVLPFLPLETPAQAGSDALVLAYGSPTGMSALTYAADEARAVGDVLHVEPHSGQAATETLLRSRAASSRVIHIAAHGQLSAVSPLFSRLLLAPDATNDGSLEVHEVYGLDLKHTDLVTLSACQTALGKLDTGDDVVGLSRAFLYTGARSVMSSLWSVDDEATAALMKVFYGNLAAGMGKAQALAAAQAAVRNDAQHPQWRHPYYWAAFVLNGDPGQFAPAQNNTPAVALVAAATQVPWWAWTAAALLVVLAVLALLFLRGKRRNRSPRSV